MKVIVTENYDEMSKKAFEVMHAVIARNPKATLGLATGTTPLGLYGLMVEDCKKNGGYSELRSANLDEYVGGGENDDFSYVYFMRKNLFDGIGLPKERTNIENGKAKDLEKECARYTEFLANNPRDIQLLGLGSNGHVAFNEPNTPFGSTTHVVNLTESTINDNARLFANKDDVPRQALTMGIKEIMQAKEILILASGKNKAKAVCATVKGEVTELVPASVLQLHPNCTLICDKDAASLL